MNWELSAIVSTPVAGKTRGVFDLKRRCAEWSVYDIKVPWELFESIRIRLLSYGSRGTVMSYTDHSAQRRFKSNTPNMSQIEQLRCLLLDVIMNIAVVIYSRQLSRWRRRGLMLLSFWRNAPIPICLNASVCANHSWSSFIYRRSEYKFFFMNLCKSPFLIMC